ncbi:MAG: hypothetical protein JOZ68_18200 [Acidimicrobiia bacterium]|nr:hypothetical protein [Acidimicrobiia bacterium]
MVRAVVVGVAAAAVAAIAVVAPARAATDGVGRGSSVTVRANPDNAVVTATKQAAANVGFGPVSAVGFHPDCSAVAGVVVVCRDPALHRGGARAVALAGSNSCVIRTSPAVGGSPHGVNVMTKALAKCLATQ